MNNCQEAYNKLVIHNFVLGLPSSLTPLTIYFVKTGENDMQMYVTDSQSNPHLIGGNGSGEVVVLNSPNGTISIEGYNIDIAPDIMEIINNVISLHNNFPDLQGGSSGEYFHLDEEQWEYLTFLADNRRVQLGNVEISGLNVTLEDVIWKIAGTEYTDNSQLFNITEASDGYYRTDIIVGNSSGQLVLVQGTESETNPVEPAIPANTILITRVNVFGDSINIPPDSEIPTLQQVMESGRTAVLNGNSPINIAHINEDETDGHGLYIDANNFTQLSGKRLLFVGNELIDFTHLDGVTVPTVRSGTDYIAVSVNGANANSLGEITIPQATNSIAGTMFLYTGTGTNTNGTMTQNAITTALALKANDDNVVHLTGVETITGAKTFSNTTAVTAISAVNNSSTPNSAAILISGSLGNGIRANTFGGTGFMDVTLSGNATFGINIDRSSTNTANSLSFKKNGIENYKVDHLGNTTGLSFIKTGGTSTQFLKADGSVDNNSYITNSNIIPQSNLVGYDVATNSDNYTGVTTYSAFPLLFNGIDNTKYLFYKQGTGHVGVNDDVVAMRKSTDGGKTFTAPVVVFDDTYNISAVGGGITKTGRIILCLGRYDATTSTRIDQSTSYSDDGGITWSTPVAFPFGSNTYYAPYKNIINIGDGKIMMCWNGNNGTTYNNYVRISSDNGTTWGASINVQSDTAFGWDETSYAYLDGGVIVGLSRNAKGSSTFNQVISTDNGNTWTAQGLVNFGSPGAVSPKLFTYIDGNGEKYVACIYPQRLTDRKLYCIVASKSGVISGSGNWILRSQTEVGSNAIDDFGYADVVSSNQGKRILGVYYKGTTSTDATLQFFNHTINNNSQDFYNNVAARILVSNRGLGTHHIINSASNINRWAYSTQNTEGGSNGGSDLQLDRFADSGTNLGAQWTLRRETGEFINYGDFTISKLGGNSRLFLGSSDGNGAKIEYNVDGNLDITPRSGYSTRFFRNVGINTNSPLSPFVISNSGTYGIEFVPASKAIYVFDRSNSQWQDLSILTTQLKLNDPSLGIDIATFTTGLSSFTSRVSGANAVNTNEFITLGQYQNLAGIKTTSSTTDVVVNPAIATSYRLNTGVTSVKLPPLAGNAGVILFFVNNTGADVALLSAIGGNDIWSGGTSTASDSILQDTVLRILHDGTQWSIL